MRRPDSLLLRCTLLLCLAVIAMPGHAVWQWMRGAALTDFKDSDWQLLRQTARDVLDNKPDHEQVNWSNPETGNRGSIIVLATFSHEGRKCRRAAMRNLTFRGRDDKAAYSLCRQEDGDWIFVSESALLAEGTRPPADNEAPQ
jgi:surface antigen